MVNIGRREKRVHLQIAEIYSDHLSNRHECIHKVVNILYGFIIPLGSIVFLRSRIRCNAFFGFVRANAADFICPMPCSADMLPPNDVTLV
mmetsp:Transcript_10148/g.20029  ORF Transcript_10148/g.20029 Transcript_10148/m.20029 type:complete len:90 (+) Transcript_10148:251-520(+)